MKRKKDIKREKRVKKGGCDGESAFTEGYERSTYSIILRGGGD